MRKVERCFEVKEKENEQKEQEGENESGRVSSDENYRDHSS